VSAATLTQMTRDFYEGFAAAAGESVRWPSTITPRAKRAISDVVRQANDLQSLSLSATGEPILHVTPHSGAGASLPPESTYVEYTSIDGKLDLISVRGNPRFTVEDYATHRRIACQFPPELMERVKDALGTRVVIEGKVKYRASGVPSSISDVKSIWTRPEPIKALDEMVGSKPDFAGDGSAEDYIRRMRRGGT